MLSESGADSLSCDASFAAITFCVVHMCCDKVTSQAEEECEEDAGRIQCSSCGTHTYCDALKFVCAVVGRKIRFTVLRRRLLWQCITSRRTRGRNRKSWEICSVLSKARLVWTKASMRHQQALKCLLRSSETVTPVAALCWPHCRA